MIEVVITPTYNERNDIRGLQATDPNARLLGRPARLGLYNAYREGLSWLGVLVLWRRMKRTPLGDG